MHEYCKREKIGIYAKSEEEIAEDVEMQPAVVGVGPFRGTLTSGAWRRHAKERRKEEKVRMEMLTLRVLAESSTRCAKRGANNTIATIVIIGLRHSEGILICTPRSVVHTSTGGVNSHAVKCMKFRQNAVPMA